MAEKHTYHDAVTGKFVTKEYAESNPGTTVKLTNCNLRDELVKFCDHLEQNGRPVEYTLIDEFLNNK